MSKFDKEFKKMIEDVHVSTSINQHKYQPYKDKYKYNKELLDKKIKAKVLPTKEKD
jgi:hypothetical protein